MKKFTLCVMASMMIACAGFAQNTVPAAISKAANKSLSNLIAPTVINVDLLPGKDSAFDIGSSTGNLSWKNGYFKGDLFSRSLVCGGVILNVPDTHAGTYYGWESGANRSYNDSFCYANSAFGYRSLYYNQLGFYNSSFGSEALFANTTGTSNSAFGYAALYKNLIGLGNCGFGSASLYSNQGGNYNTAVGDHALENTNGSNYNTAVGNFAFTNNYSGSNNTAIGAKCGSNTSNTASGSNNTITGAFSFINYTTGSNNTTNGYKSLYNNTEGNFNTAIGSDALGFNQTGSYNTAGGSEALFNNTIGSNNTASGYQALYNSKSGEQNTASGYQALYSATTADNNVATGYKALYANTTAPYNTADGFVAMIANTTGYDNTAIGGYSLNHQVTGKYNTGLGYGTDVTAANLCNATAVGSLAQVDASNKVVVGNIMVNSIGGQVSWTSFSDERIKSNINENVPGLIFIKALRPVTYHFIMQKENELLGIKNDTSAWSSKHDIEAKLFTGFLAQEVDAAAKKIDYDFSGVDKSGKIMGLRYSDFVVPLVKSVQELSVQNDSLKTANNQMQSQLSALIKRMDALESAQQQCCSKSAGNQQSAIAHQQVVISSNDAASLQQNAPNPFNGSCTISYYIPGNSHNAQLLITDVSGHTLKTYSLTTSGYGKQIINDSQLRQGEYAYSLWVDGKLIDTKKMELLK